ncbi:hypothetical protein AKO1_015571 [Acrasis kona]|uniref:Protein kinase domain-containing protein n=1 Tax=Acrasis kona TaxID=1008807 RepID=A0AAW2ZGD4_9EUKA
MDTTVSSLAIVLPYDTAVIERKFGQCEFYLPIQGGYGLVDFIAPWVVRKSIEYLDEKDRAEKLMEVQVLLKMNGKHFVKLYDYYTTCFEGLNVIFLFLERVDYCLIDLLYDGQTLYSRSQVFDIVDQILLGLEILHGEGHVHRDIKPDNLGIKESNGKLIVKILDLGLVARVGERVYDNNLPWNRVLKDDNRIASYLDDLYSVGVILQQLLINTNTDQQETKCVNMMNNVVERACELGDAVIYASASHMRQHLKQVWNNNQEYYYTPNIYFDEQF